jgi:CAAX protease family protein
LPITAATANLQKVPGIKPRRERLRAGAGLVLVVIAYLLQPYLLRPVFHWLRVHLFLPPSPANNLLYCSTYVLLVSLRLVWWVACAAFVFQIDRDAIVRLFPLRRRSVILWFYGLCTGLLVMAGMILLIAAIGGSRFTGTDDSVAHHLKYGAGWMLGEIILASSEELLFRGLIFGLVARLADIRIAMLVSALAFVYIHGQNPGASEIWLVRLAVTGLLLCYSVLRSGSLWWPIGYHAGWNWASAPLFGVAGSGYMNEGHILSFMPQGTQWLTGGAVGPEGSVLAFLAVGLATVFLLATVPNRSHCLAAPQIPSQ